MIFLTSGAIYKYITKQTNYLNIFYKSIFQIVYVVFALTKTLYRG